MIQEATALLYRAPRNNPGLKSDFLVRNKKHWSSFTSARQTFHTLSHGSGLMRKNSEPPSLASKDFDAH
jgi:hypothetical protein